MTSTSDRRVATAKMTYFVATLRFMPHKDCIGVNSRVNMNLRFFTDFPDAGGGQGDKP